MGSAMAMNYTIVREHLNNLTEDDLVKAAQKGDLDSFNHLVLLFQDRIFGFVSRILGDEDLAADITQDAFIKAYQSLPQFRNGSFRSWLYRIAKNTAFDEMRRTKKHAAVSLDYEDEDEEDSSLMAYLPNDDPSPEQEYERAELSQTIQAALDQLNQDQRAVITLIDIQDFDYQEAAETLGTNIGTIKSRLARARQQLREILVEG
jgi:RNA polymerase sigma-70 factor (ECF subfamily)